jgi:hypothetical protein
VDSEVEAAVMSPRQIRFGLLTRLAWHVGGLGRAVLVEIPGRGEAVLWAALPNRRRFAVLAAQREQEWVFVWGAFECPVEPIEHAARRIAEAAG